MYNNCSEDMCFLIPLLSGSDQGTQLLSYMKFLPIVCIY